MKKFITAFGPMILTVVGIIMMLGSLFFYENVEVLKAIFVFGIWCFLLPRVVESADSDTSLISLIRRKHYGMAIFGLLVTYIVAIYMPIYALFLLCPVILTTWVLLICTGLGVLIFIIFLLYIFIKYIVSTYKEAMEKYRT